ncbi:MAG: hypothetical protein IT281_09360 [Ignavibacteria bacterium]|nr:hypothetical protein [Ignavibacteria bacterium]
MKPFFILLIIVALNCFAQTKKDWWWKYSADTPQGETVWVDTLYSYTYDAGLTDFNLDSGTPTWHSSFNGRQGVAEAEVTVTGNAFIFNYVSIAEDKEIKVECSWTVASAQSGDQIGMLWMPFKDFPLETSASLEWQLTDTSLIATAGMTQLRFYFGHLNAYQNYSIGDKWYFDYIRILGKQE